MKIKPLFNQLLIRPMEQKTVLVSQEPTFLMYGEVLAVGPQVKRNGLVGKTICYTLWGLNHIEIEGIKHYFVPFEGEFVLGIYEPEQE